MVPTLHVLEMDPADRRPQMIRRGSALVAALCVWAMVRFRRLYNSRPAITYGPLSARDEQRQRNLSFIYNSTDTHCVELLRMRRAPFFQLCDLFRSRGLLKDTIHCNIEEQVSMFLHIVGHNQRFSSIKLTYRRSTETTSRHFQEVLYAVGELRNEMILPPSSAVPIKIQNSHRWHPYFKVRVDTRKLETLKGIMYLSH